MGRPLKPPWIVVDQQKDEIAIINTQTDQVYVSNRSAAAILDRCDGTRDEASIIDALAVQFSAASVEEIAEHVTAFLVLAKQRGLVVEAP